MDHSAWALNIQAKQVPEVVNVDQAWVALFPENSKIIATAGLGGSLRSQTARIDVQLEDGDDEIFFLKVARDYDAIRGEYESMAALYQVAPHMIPKPIGFGVCDHDPTAKYLLCQYVPLYDELPDIVDLCQDMAGVHLKSMEYSDGKFGFPVSTYNDVVPQKNEWTSSWETFFIEALKYDFQLERDTHGPCEEIERLLPNIIEKVCPRLLRPLETEGRVLKPCLVHGNCWEGNIAIHNETGQAYLYNPCAFWGHNEYEMHTWRGERYRLSRSFVNEYFNHFSKSPPQDDWDDRNLLYSLRADLHNSIQFPSANNFRNFIIHTMTTLVEKFPRGYIGSACCKDEMVHPNKSSQQPEPQLATSDDQSTLTPTLSGAAAQTQSKDVSPSIAALLHGATLLDVDGHDFNIGQSSRSYTPKGDGSETHLVESAIFPF